jgi:hypothetical protein
MVLTSRKLPANGLGKISGSRRRSSHWIDEVAALHHAAGSGKEEIVRILLKRGLLLPLREPFYDGTPVGWADFYDRQHLRDSLLNQGAVCLFDAPDYGRLDRVPDILARATAAISRPFAKAISRKPRPEDWQTQFVRMVDRGKTEAVRLPLEHGACVAARHPDGRSRLQIARDNGFASWPNFRKHLEAEARANSPVSKFEGAAEAIASGDRAALGKLLSENPELTRAFQS